MTKSDSINELAAALAKAQAEMEPAEKTKQNPFFKSKYADLDAVWKVARGPLTKNGLSVTQTTHQVEGKLFLETTLLHSSGQFISGTYPINPVKPDPQGIGSAVTYARRYSLAPMIGIVTEDDDGNAGSDKTTEKKDSVPAARAPAITVSNADWKKKPVTEKQITALKTMAPIAGYANDAMKEWLKKDFGRASAKDLTQGEASVILDTLKKEIEEGKNETR